MWNKFAGKVGINKLQKESMPSIWSKYILITSILKFCSEKMSHFEFDRSGITKIKGLLSFITHSFTIFWWYQYKK